MATLTQRLGLRKAAGTDNVDVVADIDNNLDLIDAEFANIVGRNRIRNGDMRIAQRGTGAFTANGYTVDGWRRDNTGGTVSTQRSGALPTNRYILSSTISGQSAAGDFATISQRIEGVETFAGKQITISFTASASVGTPKIGVEVEQNFGSGGSPSTNVLTAISAVTISTTLTRYSVTVTLPSITGKTLGTNGDDYVCIWFWLSAGTTFAARSSNIGIQNTTINLTDVQAEEGAYATKFERLNTQQQLSWCQRYLFGMSLITAQEVIGQGIAASATGGFVEVNMPVVMRTKPTYLSASTVGSFWVSDRLANFPVTNLTQQSSSFHQVELNFTCGGGGLAGHWPITLYTTTGGVPALLLFSAEL